MKITTLLIILGIMNVMASNSYSQNARISIDVRDVSIEKVLDEIENQSEFYFLFNQKLIDMDRKVQIKANKEKIENVLNDLFVNTNINYVVFDRQIVLTTSDATEVTKGIKAFSNNMKAPGLMSNRINLAASAQERQVSGTIKSGEDKEGLPGVNVYIEGTTQGTVTDLNGNFSLAIPDDDAILVFSSVGFLTERMPVGNKSVFNLELVPDITQLEELVVVGYGTQKKGDVTGSVSQVSKDAIESRPNNNVLSLLQGKAAGVRVLSSSGKPSQGFDVRIRGINSINAGSSPLYVVDGVPTTNTRSINPADVESISVLKDASSAAIYGAQGANGVVIITTKMGSSEKPQLSLSAYGGFSQVWNTLGVLNGEQYRDLMMEMGQTTDWQRYNKNTDWQQEIFQKGYTQNYQIALSGKSEQTNYYVSGGWVEQIGAVRSSRMDRANFKINIDQKVNDWLSMGSRIAYTKYADVDVNDNSDVNRGGVLTGALNTPSVIGIYNEDGTFTSNPFQNWENPVASTDGSDREYNSQRMLANMYVKVDFLQDFSFKSNLGVDFQNGMYDYFLDPYRTSYGRALKGQGINNIDKTSYHIFDNTLNYDKTLGQHNFKVLAGAVVQRFLWENSSIERRNFASDGITTVNGGSEINSATASKSEKANSSFIGRVNYSFSERYLLTANFRADGSSIFGPENRWGYFPSFSAGWRLSEESFMQNIDLVTDLKVRAGWGVVGNDQITNYAYLGRVGSGANYPIGGIAMPGTYPASIQNNTLKWEESEQTNIGIDLGMFNGRLNFVADAYIKSTNDLLLNAPLPKSTGYDNATQNIGKLENKGLEFSLSSVNIDKEVNWTTDFNISFNRNEVVDIVGQEMYAGSIAGRGEASLVREGLPLGTLFGYVYGGVDPATGNVYYIDKAGESTFTPSPDDRTIIGDANPDFIYGFTNTLSYKGLSLSIFLEGAQGNDMLNATKIDMESMTDPKNQSKAVLRRWRSAGDVTDIPKSSWGNTDNSRISTRFIENGSYLRVRTINVSYDFPAATLANVKLSGVKVYATGENLFTITNYSGFDPEVNAFGGSNTAQGIDYGTYPQTRNFIVGLNITF